MSDNSKEYAVSLDKGDLPPFLKNIKNKLAGRVIGQPRPIRRIIRGIANYYAGLNDPKRPLGVFMFAGSSGSGKTYLAEELAYAFIGRPSEGFSPLITIDCASLSQGHTVASLTGSPPGYVGYGDQVSLEMAGEYDRRRKLVKLDKKMREIIGEARERLKDKGVSDDWIKIAIAKMGESLASLRERVEEECGPFRSIILFDEIEKADMNIQAQLLRILDEGVIDLHKGIRVNLRGSIIILTTNVGTEQILSEYLAENKIGFSLPHKEKIEIARNLNEEIYRRVLREVFDRKKRNFKPELLSRIGKQGIIVFNVLSYKDYQKIIDLQLNDFQDQLLSKNGPGTLSVSYTPKFKDFLIQEGVSPVFGARALRNVIDKYVRTPISEKILEKRLKIGDAVLLDIELGKEENRTIISRQERRADAKPKDFKVRDENIPDFEGALDRYLEEFLKELKKQSFSK